MAGELGDKPFSRYDNAAARVAAAMELGRRDEAALWQRVGSAKDPMERAELIRGLFAHLADSLPPKEAILRAMSFDGADQETALKELAAVWMGSGPEMIPARTALASAVLQAGLALIRSPNARPGTKEAWVEAFRGHPARLELTTALASLIAAPEPERAFAMADGFSDWERTHFEGRVLMAWAARDPGAARQWLNRSNNENGLRYPWNTAAYGNADWVAQALVVERDPATRLEMIRALATRKAPEGTREALAWADSLTDPVERDAAHERIYEATPRGIGTVLAVTEGFPVIRSVLPESAAERAGLQAGDRFLEVTGPDGTTVTLYQQPIETAVRNLQGESGETIAVRILRNESGGVPTEHVIEVTRDQIIFPPATANVEPK
jgi:hypothetical protein